MKVSLARSDHATNRSAAGVSRLPEEGILFYQLFCTKLSHGELLSASSLAFNSAGCLAHTTLGGRFLAPSARSRAAGLPVERLGELWTSPRASERTGESENSVWPYIRSMSLRKGADI